MFTFQVCSQEVSILREKLLLILLLLLSITLLLVFSFPPKNAIVTGGAVGLGSAYARALAGAGANVSVCDIIW